MLHQRLRSPISSQLLHLAPLPPLLAILLHRPYFAVSFFCSFVCLLTQAFLDIPVSTSGFLIGLIFLFSRRSTVLWFRTSDLRSHGIEIIFLGLCYIPDLTNFLNIFHHFYDSLHVSLIQSGSLITLPPPFPDGSWDDQTFLFILFSFFRTGSLNSSVIYFT